MWIKMYAYHTWVFFKIEAVFVIESTELSKEHLQQSPVIIHSLPSEADKLLHSKTSTLQGCKITG